MYKVVFHVDDEERVEGALRNITNLYKDMDGENEEVKVELLANSSGIKPFKKENKESLKNIGELLSKGLVIALCNNTLTGLKLKKEDFLDQAIIVRSGVGELTRKQSDGWAYIKP